jgi:hypothetical protein
MVCGGLGTRRLDGRVGGGVVLGAGVCRTDVVPLAHSVRDGDVGAEVPDGE